MKKGQSVITLTFKNNGESFLFGSLSAIYAKYSAQELGITYPSLRNAVSTYIEKNNINEEQDCSHPDSWNKSYWSVLLNQRRNEACRE